MKNNNLIYPLATTVKPTKARQRSKSGIVISLLCWISCLALTLCATDHTYSNPILSVQKKAGADPALFFHQGIFYFYSTNEDNRVFSSTDMVNWTPGQQVLPDHLKGAWAPEPYYHAETQKFYIYYTFHYKIGVAVGDRPDAMFTDLGILCLDGIDVDCTFTSQIRPSLECSVFP